MRRIQMFTAVALILIGLNPAYDQSSQTRRWTPPTGAGQARTSEPFRVKKLLVKELPKGSQGFVFGKNDPGDDDDKMSGDELAALVLLGAGAVAALYAAREPGYRFVTQPDKTVAVLKEGGDGRILESFSCRYQGERGKRGTCSVRTYKRAIYCVADSGNGSCELSITINGTRHALALY
jgi:hypothetical protein